MNGDFGLDNPGPRLTVKAPSPAARDARALANHLKSRRLSTTPDLAKWTQTFERLHQHHEDVSDILRWFIHHPESAKVYGATSFAKQLKRLREKMEDDPAALTISPAAGDVARRLLQLHWPKGSDGRLPYLVQRCITAYAPFWEKFIAFRSTLPTMKGKEYRLLQLFCDHLTEARLLSKPPTFVEWWLELQRERVANWPEWNGNVRTLVWTPDLMRPHGRHWSYDYFNQSRYWDQLEEGMG